jgi:hypothetical protein
MDDEDEIRELNMSSRPKREEKRKQRERERLEREMERELAERGFKCVPLLAWPGVCPFDLGGMDSFAVRAVLGRAGPLGWAGFVGVGRWVGLCLLALQFGLCGGLTWPARLLLGRPQSADETRTRVTGRHFQDGRGVLWFGQTFIPKFSIFLRLSCISCSCRHSPCDGPCLDLG